MTVVSRDGNSVVLSQGGNSVTEGTRYAAVILGKELKDPQTGESLGRTEAACCQIVVDRVAGKLSYGHLENVQASLDKVAPGDMQLRGVVKSSLVAAASTQASASDEPSAASGSAFTKAKPAATSSEDSKEEAPDTKKADSRW